MEVLSILHDRMEKEVKVFDIKEDYQYGNNINSKVLAFAFPLSAKIEISLISLRIKETLDRKKSEGMRLGRPIGPQNKEVKLTDEEEDI